MARVRRAKSGAVLTPEIEEALADEAEAGYDLEAATPRKVGRPSLGRGVSPRLDLRIEPDLAALFTSEPKRSIAASVRSPETHSGATWHRERTWATSTGRRAP